MLGMAGTRCKRCSQTHPSNAGTKHLATGRHIGTDRVVGRYLGDQAAGETDGEGLVSRGLIDLCTAPIGLVVPVDVIAVGGNRSIDMVSAPLGCQVAVCVDLARRLAALSVRDADLVALLLNEAGLHAAIRIPFPGQTQRRWRRSSRTACPEGSVGPVDLAPVRSEFSAHRGPAGSDDSGGAISAADGAVAHSIVQDNEIALVADRGAPSQVTLRTPLAQKS